MERFTTPAEGGYTVDPARQAEANRRLGIFEDYYEALEATQAEAAEKLEALRAAGKKNSAQFKELLGQKLMDSNTLLMLKLKGIE